jgi:hypothetical protein
MTALERKAMSELLAESVCEVFASSGVEVTRDSGPDDAGVSWYHPVAIIGFAGKNIAGTLCLATPWELLRSSNPSNEALVDGDLLDWSRELSNLLLGSIKLALLDRDLPVEMGIPTSVLSADFQLQVSAGSRILQLFTFDGLKFPALLSAELSGAVDLTDIRPGKAPAADMLLF